MATNGDHNADSPVPLDTIPISPAKENVDPSSNAKEAGTNGAAKTGDEQITVFHDKDNFNVKHPLMHEWTLWFTKPPSGKVCSTPCEGLLPIQTRLIFYKGDNWNDLLKEVVTFDSVEEFWGIYVCPKHPSSLTLTSISSSPIF